MLSTLQKRLIGLGLIVGGAIIIFLGVSKPDPFAQRYVYWAVFNTSQGLGSIDRDVRVAGLKVGTVGEVTRVGDDVRAELVLSHNFAIHEDARADMRPHTLLEGSDFVDLSPGSPSAPLLKPGAEIPIQQTTNYVTLDEALRVLRPEIRNNLRQLAEVGARTLRGKAITGLQETLKRAPALTENLAVAARAAQGSHRNELAGAVSGLAKTTDAVAAKEDQLRPLAGRLNRTAAAVAVDGAAPLDAALRALPGALTEVRDGSPELTALIDRVDDFSGELTPALPSLRVALRDATPVLKRATPVLRKATPLLQNTRLIASRLGDAGAGGLTKMLTLLHMPLKDLTAALDVANAKSRYGEQAYHQLVAGGFAGADSMFRSYQTPSQNPNAPGHMFRIGAHLDPAALAGLTSLLGSGTSLIRAPSNPDGLIKESCADISQVSRSAARALDQVEACR
ncbi:MAG: phospholipid/cholesterol/gamma-HCH transport system substrate-binding protein [Thermoleophilaceae bacterium]|nr:phospholipid/cholesterol/gamma-HCH transport system substrate-binding protein [Thermoleophilaceae bacterium]